MKTKQLLLAMLSLFMMIGIAGCKSDKGGNEIILYAVCSDGEQAYIDTTILSGRAYLFKNNAPEEMEEVMRQGKAETGYLVGLVYSEEDGSAKLFMSSPEEESISNICNYPDFAKKWNIPSNGIKIQFTGEALKKGASLTTPPIVSYDLILTELRKDN